MRVVLPSRGLWPALAVLAAVAGALVLGRAELGDRRAAFETDARIAHRLLSQRVVQHDAILATLTLLQPGDDVSAGVGPERRLPALYPQVLAVQRRPAGERWPEAALQAADDAARQAGRAVLAQADFEHARYTVVRAGMPSSYALQIDLEQVVPWDEWPLRRDGDVRIVLRHGAQAWTLQPGRDADPAWWRLPGWSFGFDKALAADSQPFVLEAVQHVGWGALPWRAIAAWVLACAGVAWALQALARQREARRRAEDLLRLGRIGRLNALGELAAGMAHELNQPLTAVLANTQAAQRLLADEPPDVDTAGQAMAQAAQQARRAAEVLSRLRRTVQPPEASTPAQVLPLAGAVQQVLDLVQPELAQQGVQVRLQEARPAEPTRVQADPVALEQIVHNLVTNALQAMAGRPGERRLDLAIGRTPEGRARLQVADTGPGIAPEALPRVFEPFYTTRRDGLGLGLSLCETLAQAMGGSLTCANRDGGGAAFTLELPAAA